MGWGERSSQRSASWLLATNEGGGTAPWHPGQDSPARPWQAHVREGHSQQDWRRRSNNNNNKIFKRKSLTSGWVSTNCLDFFFFAFVLAIAILYLSEYHTTYFSEAILGHSEQQNCALALPTITPFPPTGKKFALLGLLHKFLFFMQPEDIKEGAGFGEVLCPWFSAELLATLRAETVCSQHCHSENHGQHTLPKPGSLWHH